MSKKKLLIILLILLSGCSKNKYVACSLSDTNSQISLEISAINDEINSIKVRTVFELPNSLICDIDKFNYLKSQLNDDYKIENNNLLIKEYNVNLDNKYSFAKTIEYLKKEKYFCE